MHILPAGKEMRESSVVFFVGERGAARLSGGFGFTLSWV